MQFKIIIFIVLFLINVWWIISSAYFLTIEGFDLITQGDGTLDYIFYSVYLKWILLADAIWISAALIFMIQRKSYKTKPEFHFLKHKKFWHQNCQSTPVS